MALKGHSVGYTKSKVKSHSMGGGKGKGMVPNSNRGGKPSFKSGTKAAYDATC